MNGIINIYKETDFTSHDVVAKLRGILRQKKIGHTGTLDPQATGVLPVCLGKATKLCDVIGDWDKSYRATLLLGKTTDTEDIFGEVLTQQNVEISEEEIRKLIQSFVGEYDQIPPMYSAKKVGGKKLYELARQGITIERKPAHVKIHSIEIVSIQLPEVVFDVQCSKGTYIRSLCRDIGEKAGCGGCMSALERRRVADFNVQTAVTLAEVEKARDEGTLSTLIHSIDSVFLNYPKLTVKEEAQKLLLNGNPVSINDCVEINYFKEDDENSPKYFRVYNQKNQFIGLYETDMKKWRVKPYKLFFDYE